jgi:Zn-dependent protease
MEAGIGMIFYLIVLICSVMVHEIAHGLMADHLGDKTARVAGRLTFNPLAHIDLFGSIILPAISYILGGIVFGWAKPVPYNPNNLRNPRKGGALIAAMGPLSNLVLALMFAVLFRIVMAIGVFTELAPLFYIIISTNVVLAIFNLVPIPPLDGSKIFYAFLPRTKTGFMAEEFLEQYGIFLLLFFIFWGFGTISPIIQFVINLFIGGFHY